MYVLLMYSLFRLLSSIGTVLVVRRCIRADVDDGEEGELVIGTQETAVVNAFRGIVFRRIPVFGMSCFVHCVVYASRVSRHRRRRRVHALKRRGRTKMSKKAKAGEGDEWTRIGWMRDGDETDGCGNEKKETQERIDVVIRGFQIRRRTTE